MLFIDAIGDWCGGVCGGEEVGFRVLLACGDSKARPQSFIPFIVHYNSYFIFINKYVQYKAIIIYLYMFI